MFSHPLFGWRTTHDFISVTEFIVSNNNNNLGLDHDNDKSNETRASFYRLICIRCALCLAAILPREKKNNIITQCVPTASEFIYNEKKIVVCTV